MLIRANFNIDPDKLSDQEFGKLYAQALWLEDFRMQQQRSIIKHQMEFLAAAMQQGTAR